MARVAKTLQDVGNERDQKVFAAIAKLWFGGDEQAMLNAYNEKLAELEKLEAEIKNRHNNEPKSTAEVQLKIPHQ